MKQTLHGRAICPFARRIRLGLLEKKIPASFNMIMGNPNDHSLPILENDSCVLSGVYAITEYIEETFTHPSIHLIPKTPQEKGEVRRLIQWCDDIFTREVVSVFVFERIYRFLWRLGMPQSGKLDSIQLTLHQHLSLINQILSERNWFADHRFSWADITLAANISCLDFLGEIGWSKYPALYQWYLKIKSRPTFTPILQESVTGISPARHYDKIDFEKL